MIDQNSDIIFALATPPGRGAIHLHRISGAGCFKAILPWIRQRKSKNGSRVGFRHRHAHYVDILSPKALGSVIDDGIVVWFESGSSFTGEESLEITTHGNPLISSALQSLFRQVGFRDAQPGEFTQRAFLNGRMDLTQAEAIRTLIDAQTEDGVALARAGSDGAIETGLQPIRADLLQARALLEAQIDFAEDEVGSPDWQTLTSLCSKVASHIDELEKSYDRGQMLLEGVSVALVGPPNAGKSSLYNALLAENRAIVSSEMGTTRDVLKERFRIQSRDFVLLDTAGIRETTHEIERIGIEKSLEVARKAHVVVLVLDLNEYQKDTATSFLSKIRTQILPGTEIILALNKVDKVTHIHAEQVLALNRDTFAIPVVLTQAANPQELEKALLKAHDQATQRDGCHSRGSLSLIGATLISQRQRDCAAKAQSFAWHAHNLCLQRELPEIIASELISCENSLQELLGRIPPEEVLNAVFGQFCIGK